MLLFAYDTVLWCEEINGFESILKIYDDKFSRLGQIINIYKTKHFFLTVPVNPMNN